MPTSTKDNRTKNWNFLLYPESAPGNWREIIDETRIEWVESPLHDKDLNPTGEEKKYHHHVTLLYPSNKSYDQVRELVVDQLGQPIPIKCQSVKGSIRYMVHKDNPEKYQYNWNEIVPHGGADLTALCAPTHTERLQMLRDIFSYIDEHNISEYSVLSKHCRINEPEWFEVITTYSTLAVNAELRSRRHQGDMGKKIAAIDKAFELKCKEFEMEEKKLEASRVNG